MANMGMVPNKEHRRGQGKRKAQGTFSVITYVVIPLCCQISPSPFVYISNISALCRLIQFTAGRATNGPQERRNYLDLIPSIDTRLCYYNDDGLIFVEYGTRRRREESSLFFFFKGGHLLVLVVQQWWWWWNSSSSCEE